MSKRTTESSFEDIYDYIDKEIQALESSNSTDSSNYVLTDASRDFTATPEVNGNQIWHAGNDGTGSGLDADTVDGIEASSFLRKDQDDATEYKLAIGSTTAHSQANLYVKRADVGTEPTWVGNEVAIFENSNLQNTVIAILSANNKRGGIAFSDNDAPVQGAISYDHSTEKMRIFTENVARLTLDDETATLAQALEVPEQAAPSTPASGYFRVYAKTDGKIYGKNDGGTEYDLTAGAGGGDVSAAANFATDNRVIRSDGTLKGVQASGVTIDDSDNVTGVVALTTTGAVTTGAEITIPEQAAPSTPASGKFSVYAKTDGLIYGKNDAGTEYDLTAAVSTYLKEPRGHDTSGITGATNHWKLDDTELGGTTVNDSVGTTDLAYNFTAVCYGRPWYSSQGQIWATPSNQTYINSGLATWIAQARDNSCGCMFWMYVPGEQVGNSFTLLGPLSSNETQAWNWPFYLELDAANYLLLTWEQGAGVDVTARTPITSGLRHVAVNVTRGATSTVDFYIDGELAKSTSGLTNPNGGTSWVDASTKFLCYYPSAQADEYAMRVAMADVVWYYSSLPTATQVRTQYKRGFGSW